MKIPRLSSCFVLVLLCPLFGSCRGDHVVAGTVTAPLPAAARAATPPQSSRDLLQLAFDAASAFPLDPHGKSRSRAQEQVVIACFQLGQPELALAYGGQMHDWRRGCAYADFAWEMARRGDGDRAREYVELARGVARGERENPMAQEWRRDLILLKVARALAALGDTEGAAKASAGIDAASANAVDGFWATTAAEQVAGGSREQAGAALAAIEQDFPKLTLGQQNVALATVAKLHEVHFADAGVRETCERLVGTDWNKVMPALRLPTLAAMVRCHVAHPPSAGGKALLATMRTIVEGHAFRPEDRLPEVARLIESTFALGDTERARADAEQALVDWHRQRDGITDIYRARSLRPLALACHVLGETRRCEELLALVLEEGLENPNSRPRCDDLVDTCVAMATRGITPSAALWQRLREIQRGLGNPW